MFGHKLRGVAGASFHTTASIESSPDALRAANRALSYGSLVKISRSWLFNNLPGCSGASGSLLLSVTGFCPPWSPNSGRLSSENSKLKSSGNLKSSKGVLSDCLACWPHKCPSCDSWFSPPMVSISIPPICPSVFSFICSLAARVSS
ncbi:hypothetical protein ABW21_db0208906 [Orbilia brochopaga]|nr:hypothetical protein ABW21_db0208906 [Drechslerella brochopaga]